VPYFFFERFADLRDRAPDLRDDFALDFFLRRAADFFFFPPFLGGGTFAPARRASDKPMAIACLRLFTFFPERPLFNVPRLRSCIARFTFCAAFFPYLAIIASVTSSPRIFHPDQKTNSAVRYLAVTATCWK
jgi:hypothetical protein